MRLRDLARVEARFSETLRKDDLEALIRLGEEVQQELAKPELLREVSRRVAEIAGERGVDSILGASPVGERIAGAVVAMGRNGIRTLSGKLQKSKHVLIVDGVFISGTQLERALSVAQDAGATETSAVVVVGPSRGDRVVPSGLPDLVVLADD